MVMATRGRLALYRSTRNASAGSMREMAEVTAAKLTRTKNTAPTTAPSGRLPKATGRVTNSSPGPSPGSRPGVAKTMGKMARPAASATTVSSTAMVPTVVVMEVRAGTYAP